MELFWVSRALHDMRFTVAISVLMLTCVACAAAEIQYPVAIPQGCMALAEREGSPTLIGSRWEGVKARAKLARMKSGDPLVRQCKDAVSQAVAEYTATK